MIKRGVLLFILLVAVTLPAAAQEPTPAGETAPLYVGADVFDRAVAAINEGDYQHVLLDSSLFILLNPTASLGYYLRSQGYFGLNDIASALGDLDRAIALSENADPEYRAGLYATRAELYVETRELDSALRDYTEAIDLNPTFEMFASRALLNLALDEFADARDDLTSALDFQPENPALYIYRGFASAVLDDQPAAAEDYLTFFSLVETDAPEPARLNSGDVIGVQMSQGAVFRFTFEAEAGQLLNALAAPQSGNIDPLLVITDPDGNGLIGSDDDGQDGAALVLAFEIPEDGIYTLVVGHSLAGFDGEMLVTFELVTAD